jgi:hypothetical protein
MTNDFVTCIMRLAITVIFGLVASVSFAQKLLPTPRNIQATYDKGTRSTDGKPGKNYWQNTADYIINVKFEPATRLLNGVVDIVYSNNSPDTLKQIWFKLYPNLYKAGSPRAGIIASEDIGEGVVIDSFWINEKITEPTALVVNGTNATLGKQLVAKGQKIRFRFAYHYTVNKGSHNRTGEVEPNAHFIAYFFPRVAVYDDIDGWNTYPYIGSQEFYNDFCSFKVSVSVPENFGVWATGDLKNGSEVLNPVYYQRLMEAEKSDAIITVIDTTEIIKRDITQGEGRRTWRFEADRVTDFAFATSDHYIWKSTSLVVDPTTKRRTRVDAVFNPKHADYFHVVYDARKTVEAMSYRFPAWPFPFSHVTVFDGLDQMEYPMMVNDNPVEDRHESIELTDHEVFHMMFPFYVGTNETKYAWMDEGWATIGEWLISPMIDSTIVDEYGVAPTSINAGRETDLPIMTLSTEMSRGYFTNSYPKPAMGYLYIKDYLGDALFTKALHNYIRHWNGKHPMPNDFFYSMNEGSGRNLNWFWKRWFFEGGIPDLAISSARKTGNKLTVVIANKGGKPLPVDLKIQYTDGTSSSQHRNIGVWEKGNTSMTLVVTVTKPINKLVLGHPHTPDANPKDNQYVPGR